MELVKCCSVDESNHRSVRERICWKSDQLIQSADGEKSVSGLLKGVSAYYGGTTGFFSIT